MKTSICLLLVLLLTPSLVAQDARERFEKLIQPKPPVIQPEPAVEPPVAPEPPSKPQVTFTTTVNTSPPERFLAVGNNCPACPQAKRNFLASGGKPENIVDYSVSRSQHGMTITVIPVEYKWAPKSTTESIVASADMEPSADALAYILAEYLSQLTAIESHNKVAKSKAASSPAITEQQTYGGWFEYDINLPDSVPFIFQKLMKDRSYKNDALGLLLQWPGEPTIKLGRDRVTFQPAIQASVRKLGITASASVSEIRFTSDYRSVTVVTPELLVPDLTINFK